MTENKIIRFETSKELFAPYLDTPAEETFECRVGNTTYEVTTHFNPNGRQCLLEQFRDLILANNLI